MAKKISTATIEKIIKANTPEETKVTYKVDDTDIDIIIKPFVPFDEYCQMANDVANLCYDENGDYHPEFFDVAYHMTLIEHFTNINVGKVHQIHILSTFTTLIDKIEATVRQALDVKKDAKAIIEHRNSTKVSPWDSVAYGVMELLDKISDYVDKSQKQLGETKPEDMKDILGLVKRFANMKDKDIVENVLKSRDEITEK